MRRTTLDAEFASLDLIKDSDPRGCSSRCRTALLAHQLHGPVHPGTFPRLRGVAAGGEPVRYWHKIARMISHIPTVALVATDEGVLAFHTVISGSISAQQSSDEFYGRKTLRPQATLGPLVII